MWRARGFLWYLCNLFAVELLIGCGLWHEGVAVGDISGRRILELQNLMVNAAMMFEAGEQFGNVARITDMY